MYLGQLPAPLPLGRPHLAARHLRVDQLILLPRPAGSFEVFLAGAVQGILQLGALPAVSAAQLWRKVHVDVPLGRPIEVGAPDIEESILSGLLRAERTSITVSSSSTPPELQVCSLVPLRIWTISG